MNGEDKIYFIREDENGLTDIERGMLFRKTIKYGTKALTPEQTIEFYEEEIEYLVSEVTRLEIENFEMSQQLRMLEIMLEDIKIGQPKGEMN
jgi:hypothetical protein